MDVLTQEEINSILHTSQLIEKYKTSVDRESAHEILTARIENMLEAEEEQKSGVERSRTMGRSRTAKKSSFEKIMTSPVTNTIARELTRGILGVFGISTTTRRRSSRTSSRRMY
jgi:hypothetical protein